MRFVGIVSSALLSGSYYNVGGASDINAFKTTNSVRTSQRTPRAWSKNYSPLPQYMCVDVYGG